jgi:hypothetical protein
MERFPIVKNIQIVITQPRPEEEQL